MLGRERAESEPSAPRLESWDDLGDVVANEAEPGCLRILFNDPSEGELGTARDCIALIENDQLDTLAHDLLRSAERLDLVPDDVDSSLIRGIELEGRVLVVFAKHLLGDGDDARSLTSAWRAVKEKMREFLLVDELGHGRDDLSVRNDVVEARGPELLDEWEVVALGVCHVELIALDGHFLIWFHGGFRAIINYLSAFSLAKFSWFLAHSPSIFCLY
jgi:hypothetical protein